VIEAEHKDTLECCFCGATMLWGIVEPEMDSGELHKWTVLLDEAEDPNGRVWLKRKDGNVTLHDNHYNNCPEGKAKA
jgi:hypothetical protein